jgi:hypothetical protein
VIDSSFEAINLLHGLLLPLLIGSHNLLDFIILSPKLFLENCEVLMQLLNTFSLREFDQVVQFGVFQFYLLHEQLLFEMHELGLFIVPLLTHLLRDNGLFPIDELQYSLLLIHLVFLHVVYTLEIVTLVLPEDGTVRAD